MIYLRPLEAWHVRLDRVTDPRLHICEVAVAFGKASQRRRRTSGQFVSEPALSRQSESRSRLQDRSHPTATVPQGDPAGSASHHLCRYSSGQRLGHAGAGRYIDATSGAFCDWDRTVLAAARIIKADAGSDCPNAGQTEAASSFHVRQAYP